MKKFLYTALITLLTLYAAAEFFALMRGGRGAALAAQVSAAAASNTASAADKAEYIYDSSLLGTKRMSIADADLHHIWIDGTRYDFPLPAADLSDDFSVVLKLASAPDEYTDSYNYSYCVYYQNNLFCMAHCKSSSPTPPEEPVFETLLFFTVSDIENKPQAVFAGVNIFNTTVEAVDKLYGYNADGEENGYGAVSYKAYIESEDKSFCMSVSPPQNGIDGKENQNTSISVIYLEAPVENDTYGITDLALSSGEYTLPDGYVPENDAYLAALSELDISAIDEEYITPEALEVDGRCQSFPCTLNSLLYTYGDGAVAVFDSRYICTDDGDTYVTINFKLNLPDTDAQSDEAEEVSVFGTLELGQPIGNMIIRDCYRNSTTAYK